MGVKSTSKCLGSPGEGAPPSPTLPGVPVGFRVWVEMGVMEHPSLGL